MYIHSISKYSKYIFVMNTPGSFDIIHFGKLFCSIALLKWKKPKLKKKWAKVKIPPN